MSDYQRNDNPLPPRKKHYLDDYKLRLTAEKVPGGEGRPSLSVTVINNNPRIDVYTNVPNDKDRGVIRAAMDALSFHVMLDRLEAVINDAPKTRFVIENKRPSKEKGQPPQVVSKTVVGKDNDGKVYISIISTDQERPKIRFSFGNSYYHQLISPDGTPLSEADVSVIFARSWVAMMRGLVSNILTDTYTDKPLRANEGGGGGKGGYPAKKPWQGGGGGGNWKDRQNNRPQSQGASSEGAPSSSNDFDDDLPY